MAKFKITYHTVRVIRPGEPSPPDRTEEVEASTYNLEGKWFVFRDADLQQVLRVPENKVTRVEKL